MKKTKTKRVIMILISLIVLLSIAGYVFMQHPSFGKNPSGDRLSKIEKSPNYKNGKFQNIRPTPVMIKGVSIYKLINDYLFSKKKPKYALPTKKSDLLNMESNKNVLVWFGHSSYYIQLDGKKILVDPVLNGHASPLSFITQSFKGTNIYTAADIPEIDYLFITHDHWDHLDYKTMLQLKPKIKKIICPLGVASHMEHWGYNPAIFSEMDWNEKIIPDSGFSVYAIPTRHFSGRTLLQNKTLWCAFVLQTPSQLIYMGGDGGYDPQFAETGKKFGAFDLVILENGQYNNNWKYIHIKPEEVLQAAIDLNARKILPVHSCKFALSIHTWDEPLKRITTINQNHHLNLITPLIGETVLLNDSIQQFTQWWTNIQ